MRYKPGLWDINQDHIVLHAGQNNLRTENTASQIAKATIDHFSLKNEQQGKWSELLSSANV